MFFNIIFKPDIQVYPFFSYTKHIYYNNIRNPLLFVLQNNDFPPELYLLHSLVLLIIHTFVIFSKIKYYIVKDISHNSLT